MSGVTTTRFAQSSLLHCAATLADAPYVTYDIRPTVFLFDFFFSSRSDQMLEDIIFKLVPGLQESEPIFSSDCMCVFLYFQPVEQTLSLSLQLPDSFFQTLPPAVHMND